MWCAMTPERAEAQRAFLAASGWGSASVTRLPGDASTRRYARLAMGERRAMLMDQPQEAELPVAPPDADADTRRRMGYNAVARLAGADVGRFAAATGWLRAQGLAAPDIYAADMRHGFLILEDLGDALFADVVAAGGDEAELYRAAVEVLAKLHRVDAPPEIGDGMPLFRYDETALLAETDLLTEWFLPLALGRTATAAESREHRALWQRALRPVLDAPPVFVHRDYHAQNLLWLPQRNGLARVGLIDFQDAVAGSRAYDLVSLLEDARRDVAPEMAEAMTAHYLACADITDPAAFRREMAVMAAQRNAKIAGIFARLYARDGKARYLTLLPRVWRYLERDLAEPGLGDLRAWYDRVIPREKRSNPGETP
jgi:aminoglycoside/choline kinase family phosphotransferase